MTVLTDERVDDLEALLAYLPRDIAAVVRATPGHLEELKLRYGERLALFVDDGWVLSDLEITGAHLTSIVARAQYFRDDGRRGIDGTGHRLSLLPAADGSIEGVTARVGRFLSGLGEPLRPFLEEDPSALIVGPPKTGKTTLLRDVIRLLGQTWRYSLMVVDSSDELTGAGRQKHRAIGLVDRLQVPSKARQAEVVEQAKRNHSPRIIALDELTGAAEARSLQDASTTVKVIASVHAHDWADLRAKAWLAPVLQPPIVRWCIFITAWGVYQVYDCREALAAGDTPAPATVRLEGT